MKAHDSLYMDLLKLKFCCYSGHFPSHIIPPCIHGNEIWYFREPGRMYLICNNGKENCSYKEKEY